MRYIDFEKKFLSEILTDELQRIFSDLAIIKAIHTIAIELNDDNVKEIILRAIEDAYDYLGNKEVDVNL